MKSKIETTKADESSFDGTAADIYSADEGALFSQHDAKTRVVRSYDEQKERLLSLFTDDAKGLIKDKHLTSETMIMGKQEIHIIYIADDEWIKDYYKKEFVKKPEFIAVGKVFPR